MIEGIQHLKLAHFSIKPTLNMFIDGKVCKIQLSVLCSTFHKGDLVCVNFSSDLPARLLLQICEQNFVLVPASTKQRIAGSNPLFFVLEDPFVCCVIQYVDFHNRRIDMRYSIFTKVLHCEKIYYIKTSCLYDVWSMSSLISTEDKIVKTLTPCLTNPNVEKLIEFPNMVIYKP